MKDPLTVFEALMRTKGYSDFSKTKNGAYTISSLVMRWNYFLLGWEMRGLE